MNIEFIDQFDWRFEQLYHLPILGTNDAAAGNQSSDLAKSLRIIHAIAHPEAIASGSGLSWATISMWSND